MDNVTKLSTCHALLKATKAILFGVAAVASTQNTNNLSDLDI